MQFDLPPQKIEEPTTPRLDLLRAPEQVLEAREKIEKPFAFLHFGNREHEIYLLGLQHTTDVAALDSLRTELRPVLDTGDFGEDDLVLVEGTVPVRKQDALSSAPKGEQEYFYQLAVQREIPALSWDLSFTERLTDSLDHHDPRAVLGFFVAQIAKILLMSQKRPTAEEIADILHAYVTPDLIDSIHKTHHVLLDVSAEHLQALCQEYAGKSIEQLTLDDTERLVDPYQPGTTNVVVSQQTRLRDEHALKTLAKAKQAHRKIFMSGGLDHILAWEPVVEEMYKNKE